MGTQRAQRPAVFAILSALVASGSAALDLSQAPDEAALVEVVWEHAPELQLARARVASARAEATDVERSRTAGRLTVTAKDLVLE